MNECLKRDIDIVYHFTKKENVQKIRKDRQLKKFKDNYVFVCESYEDCINVIKNTILNPKARYMDFDGVIRDYKNRNINDYVILKLKTRYSDSLKWFKSTSSNNSCIDDKTIAYKGNLPIKSMDEIEITI